MRKKILAILFFLLLSISTLLLTVSWHLLKESRYSLEEKYLNTTIDQIIETIEKNQLKKERAIKLYTDDYLTRLHFIRYLIGKKNKVKLTQNDWKEITEVTKVRGVYIVDKNGIITDSNDKEVIGKSFYLEKELKSFIPLLEGKINEGYLLLLEGISIKDQKQRTYLGLYEEGGGMLQIDTNPETITSYLQASSLAEIIKNIPTREEEILFVLNKTNKKLIGLSKNNRKIKDENKLFNDAMLSLNTPKFIVADGKKYFVLTKEKNNKLIGIAVEEKSVLADAGKNFFKGIIVISIISVIIFIYLYYILNSLILKDLDVIMKKLNSFCNGDRSISFGTGKTKEISKLKNQLNNVIEAFETRPTRIENMIKVLGDKYGLYEYYYTLKQLYTSNNLGKLLGKDEKTYKDELIKYVEQFEDKAKLTTTALEILDEHTTKEGRIIKIRRVLYNNVIYAVLEDITESINQRKFLEKSLLEEKEKSYIDSLTGLYNRKKLDDIVKEVQGIILLIDLDNFKKVNDEKGHIEGDFVLKIIGKLLNSHFVEESFKIRLGGDEFMILLNKNLPKNMLEKKIKHFIKKVRDELKEYYTQQKLSVSVGAVYTNKNSFNFETMYDYADKAMYIAKKNGKDSYYILEID